MVSWAKDYRRLNPLGIHIRLCNGGGVYLAPRHGLFYSTPVFSSYLHSEFTVVAKVELSRNCKENVAAMVDIYSRGGAGPRTRLPSQGCLVPPLIAATPALTAR